MRLSLKILGFICTLLFATNAVVASNWPSESDWVKGRAGSSEVRLINSDGPISPAGKSHQLGLEFKLKGDWHIYWKNPGDTGFAPKLQWKLPTGWKADSLLFPTPSRKIAETLGVVNGYSKSVIFPVTISGASKEGVFELSVVVDYLVCDVQCIPEKAELKLNNLTVSAKPLALASSQSKAISEALQKLPEQGKADIKKISESQFRINIMSATKVEDLFVAADQKLKSVKINRISDQDFEVSIAPKVESFEWVASLATGSGLEGQYSEKTPVSAPTDMSLWLALLFAFLGGAILNLMPCVLPVLMLKSIGLIKLGSAKTSSIKKSLMMTALGILVSFAVLAGIFIFLQSVGRQVGWGFHFQSPLFVSLMSLVIFLFALNLFDVFQFQLGSATNSKLATSARGPFFEGVFASLLATPCSAPFLGTALTFAFSQSAVVLFVMMIVMGLGLALPYFILMTAPEALRFFPKPGNWMDTMKRILGYALLITTIWLLYILQQQTGSLAIVFSAIAFLVVFVALREFKSMFRWAIVFLIAMGFSFGIDRLQTKSEETAASSFAPFSEETLQSRLAAGETLYVVVTADWCLTCKYNENFVMKTDWFKSLLSKHEVVEVVYDWTSRDDNIARFLGSYNRVGIPFSMLISKDKTLLFPELLSEAAVRENFTKFFASNTVTIQVK